MPYAKWEKIEQKYQKAMPQILIELYEKHGNHRDVANELGITIKGLREWREHAGCRAIVRLECTSIQPQE